jgi:hypothetical protein
MNKWRGLIALTIALVSLFFVSSVAAQDFQNSADLNQTVIIGRNGTSLLDGKSSGNIKLDIRSDQSTWRYQAVKESGEYIARLTVTVHLPEGVSSNQVKPTIYAVHGVESYDSVVIDNSTIEFTAVDIGGDATVTFTLDFPGNAFQFGPFDALRSLAGQLPLQAWLAIAILLPLSMLGFSLTIFFSRSADIYLKPNAAPQLALPSQLPPALVGVLVHGYVGMREIAATLIDLAQRGYIDIIFRSEGDFAFSQKRAWQNDPKLHDFERFFLSQIFTDSKDVVSNEAEIDQKMNKNVWSDSITQAIERIYAQMAQLGYFPANPKQAHLMIRFVGIIVFFISVLGLAASLLFFREQPYAAIPWVIAMISSPIITRAALLVPRRTEAGRAQAALWLAFRRDLAAPLAVTFTEEGKAYEQFLAYAIVLSVESAWTARFTSLPCTLPTWFYTHGRVIDNYGDLAGALFSIVGWLGNKFSFSRKPTAL